ncbi:MAG: methionine--tRNA ligase, partial [Atopobiaceae bacterium]|nr:methionine--tRNA ligase [Atopobiaceae bacterium]
NLLESIRICAHLLAPFMPETSAEVLRRMSLEDEADTADLRAACAWGGLKGDVPVTKGDALFPRLQSTK